MIDAKIEIIGEVLKDSASYPEWISGCERTDVLRDGRDNILLHYFHDFPWPISDRDVVLNANIKRDFQHGRFVVDTTSLPGDDVPLQEGLVRMSKMTSQYLAEFVSRDKTKVTYIIHVDPGGSLSPSLVNSNMKKLTYKNLTGLKNMTEKPIYKMLAEKSGETALVEAAILEASYDQQDKRETIKK